ncbi:MAG: DUF4382 domain-containing protein [Thiotrichaceae bacterium]|nr:DUF4382 domain-containing protein [Thiotrichaceae bacterium]
MQRKYSTFLSIIIATLLLAACSDSSNDNEGLSTALLSLNITDAPVDEAEKVVIEFTSVTLLPNEGDEIVFTFEDESKMSIDLLALQGVDSQPLLENVEIPAGSYNQIRLGVNAEYDDVMDSYITIDGVQYELRVPSGSQTGLKLNTPFTVAEGTEGMTVADENAVYTIDFDLRKSITDPVGQPGYILKPVLRLIQNSNTGSISGTVDPTLLTTLNCSDTDPVTGNAVYVFEGNGVKPDDFTSEDVDDTDIDPVTTSLLNYDDITEVYSYEVGFLSEGSYTVAFTCAADQDDEFNNDDVFFDAVGSVDVIAGENTDLPLNDSSTAGRISLNITDAPVDDADEVVIEFTSVTFLPDDGDAIVFNFIDNPATPDEDESKKSIDLLALQGVASQPLIENEEIPAGDYNQIRLGVNAEYDDIMDSYITIDGIKYELRVPSGSQTGLKLNTAFTVAVQTAGMTVADDDSIYTIDFDLRKSITDPKGQPGYILKPVLKLVQNINTGSISGKVSSDLVTGKHCLTGNAVYVFEGNDVVPDDFTSADFDDKDIDPVTTSLVKFDESTSTYVYEVGFLSEGPYTLAFTCMANLDDEEDNLIVFDSADNVDVIAGEDTYFPID